MTDPLKLAGKDADDLQVISAMIPDALVPLADVAFLADEQRFVLALNRYRWNDRKEQTRTHAILSFQQVQRVQSKGLSRRDPDKMLSLLGVTGENDIIQLEFSENGTIRLIVAAIDCQLIDVGEPWPAASTPAHPD